jgi:hypothetical protein
MNEKWTIILMGAVILVLCIVTWGCVALQIIEMKTSIAVLQAQNVEINKTIVGLTTRVTDLVATINERGNMPQHNIHNAH